MNFNDEQQATVEEIENHPEVDTDLLNDLRLYIIEPEDVLYYLNAFGDVEMAVRLQPLPKDLPDAVLKKMAEYDVLSEWQGEVVESECPCCGRELFEFDWKYDWLIIDEYGRNQGQDIWFLNDPAGIYWDTRDEHHVLCSGCANDRGNFSYDMDSHEGFKVHYGESDEWYPFSYENGVVRRDAEWYMDNKNVVPKNLRDAKGEHVHLRELEKAVASPDWRDLDSFMEELGYTEIIPSQVNVGHNGVRKTEKYAKSVFEKWASVTDSTEKYPTHPDFHFTYMIEDGNHLFIPEEEHDFVMRTLEEATLAEVNQIDSLSKAAPK